MQFVYLCPSGKVDDVESGPFWTIAGAAVPVRNWQSLQLRFNSLQKSFLKKNYTPGRARMDPATLLHPDRVTRSWNFGLLRGVQRLKGQLGI